MRISSWRLVLLAILAALAPVALAQREAKPAAKHSVSIKEMKFDPATLEIKVGDSVAWTNSDDRDHTVNGPDGTFKSDNLKPGATYTYKFTKVGRFAYSCSYHPRMKGTITVKEDEPPKGRS